MSRIDGRFPLRRRALIAVVAASIVWSGIATRAAVAAPVQPPAGAADADAGLPAAPCTSPGLLAVDARGGEVDQWSVGEQAGPRRLGAATPVADGVRGARLIAADAGRPESSSPSAPTADCATTRTTHAPGVIRAAPSWG